MSVLYMLAYSVQKNSVSINNVHAYTIYNQAFILHFC